MRWRWSRSGLWSREINLSPPGIESRIAGRPARTLDTALRCAGVVYLEREEIYVSIYRRMVNNTKMALIYCDETVFLSNIKPTISEGNLSSGSQFCLR